MRQRGPSQDSMLCPSVDAAMAVLSGGFRYDLIRLLLDQWRSVSELARLTDLPAAQISKDLHVLRAHALVEMRQEKNFHYYRISQHVRVHHEETRLIITVCTLSGDELVVRTFIGESEADSRMNSTTGQDSSTLGTKSKHVQA